MPQSRKTDPLLAAANILALILMGVSALIAAGCLGGIVGVLALKNNLTENIPPETSTTLVLALICTMLLLGAASFACAFRFAQFLRRMIATVRLGEPFILENARRLWLMGWLALGIQVLVLAVGVLANWFNSLLPGGLDSDNMSLRMEADVELSLGGIVLVVMLFVLARVFRKGAQMREDLEGTV